MNRIVFQSLPPAGTVIALSGQRYELIDQQPYRRQDGHQTIIPTWRSECADCGGLFTLTTGLSVGDLNRRCPRHHRPGVPVRRSRRAYRWRGAHG
jgi:hypothetical protein